MAVFRAACVQLCSGTAIDPNIETVTALIRQAHARGAQLVLTPENTNMLEPRTAPLFEKAESEEDDRCLRVLRELCVELDLWLVIGGMAVRASHNKVANRSFLIAPDGGIRARYDKIHLFDVDLPGGESYRESKNYRPGRDAVVADLPWGRIGLTICYDLRFPSLYRLLSRAGAAFLTAPSAFTRATGEAHWHVLLRARAIENGAYVLAPAQTGDHEGGRSTYGHSLIVDPWGRVLADGGTEPGVVVADIDPHVVRDVRTRLPVLNHERPIGIGN